MYTGQIASITNQETWVSDFIQFIDEDTGLVLNILNVDIGFDCSVYIKDRDGTERASKTLGDGIIASASDVADEPGIQWVFSVDDLSDLEAGTYICGVKVTANAVVTDVVVGTIAVTEGN